jgi:ankyrin repeat protein
MEVIYHIGEKVAIKMIDIFGVKCIPEKADETGYTALMWACAKKNIIIAEKMLHEFGAHCNIMQKNKDGCNALNIATAKKLKNVIKDIVPYMC